MPRQSQPDMHDPKDKDLHTEEGVQPYPVPNKSKVEGQPQSDEPTGKDYEHGQEKDGHFQAMAPQALEDLPSIHSREHDIQDDQVVVAFLRHVKAIDPVVHQIGIEARLAQALAQVFAGFDFIFYDQYLHGRLP